MDKQQSVSLGCGTLILIALIVVIFGSAGDQQIERELRLLRTEVEKLRDEVRLQSGAREPSANPGEASQPPPSIP